MMLECILADKRQRHVKLAAFWRYSRSKWCKWRESRDSQGLLVAVSQLPVRWAGALGCSWEGGLVIDLMQESRDGALARAAARAMDASGMNNRALGDSPIHIGSCDIRDPRTTSFEAVFRSTRQRGLRVRLSCHSDCCILS